MSEVNYQEIIDDFSDGVFQVNGDGYFTYVNKAITSRYGITLEKFRTLHFLDIVDPRYQDFVKVNFHRVMGGEDGIVHEIEHKDADGQVRCVELHSSPIREGGKIVGLMGISRDITGRKQTEEKLKASETKFRNLIESIPVGIFIYEGTKYIYVNPAFEKMTGYTQDELRQMDIWDIIHPQFKDEVRGYVRRRQMGGSVPERHILKIVTKGGEERWMKRGAVLIELAENPSVLIAVTDITESKSAEEALRRSDEKYRSLLENASDAILIGDKHGNIFEANRMAEELLGYTREELRNINYSQLRPMMEPKRTIDALKRLVRDGYATLHDASICRKDGKVVPVDITASVVQYGNMEVIQALFRDITEQKHVEDSLERLVSKRTTELSEKNERLMMEIKERERVEASLRKRRDELKLRAGELKELNSALKVLLKQRDEDRRELEEKVMANIRELVLPYLEELKKGRLDARSKTQVSILEANLNNITSSFTQRLSSKYSGFTPREIQVANMIRQGKSTKEMAEYMRISPSAINLYRNGVRKKLGIISRKINLKSYLMSLS